MINGAQWEQNCGETKEGEKSLNYPENNNSTNNKEE
jgi:hypothetical protein